MGKVLVTGFEPFGKEETNPSEKTARVFRGRAIAGFTVIG